MIGLGVMSIKPNPLGAWINIPILLMVMVEEVIGRVLYYKVLEEKTF
jgi:hypothetical protein